MRKLFIIIGFGLVSVAATAGAASATHTLLDFESALDAAVTFGGPEIASHAPEGDPNHDFAVGGGQHLAGGTGPDFVSQGLAAQSGPLGEDPRGHVSAHVTEPEPDVTIGHVLCLDVVGNEAFILWEQEMEGQGIPPGTPILTHIVDNGPPLNGTPVDLIRNSFSDFVIPPEFGGGLCGLPVLPPVPVIRGNYLVHDALS